MGREADPWLVAIAARHGQPVEAIVQLLDRDPLALASEIAAIQYRDTLALARHLADTPAKDRAKALTTARASDRDTDRLAAAIATSWVTTEAQQQQDDREARKARALAYAADQLAKRAAQPLNALDPSAAEPVLDPAPSTPEAPPA